MSRQTRIPFILKKMILLPELANGVTKPALGLEVKTWWEKELANLPKKNRRLKAAVMIYGAWNIWKARNKKIFEQKTLTPGEVLQEIKSEMLCRSVACGRPELSSFNV